MEPAGLKRIGLATLIVGLVLGIIVPFAQFGGMFPAPWILGVVVLPVLWGAMWVYVAHPSNWWLVLLGQWMSLAVACWLFFATSTSFSPQALMGGAVFGTLLLAVWMIPVGVIAVLPRRH